MTTQVFPSQIADTPGYNLLTNPGFERWQRGAGAFTAGGAYTADTWQAATATSTFSITQITSTIGSVGSSAQLVYTHGAGGLTVLVQLLENPTTYRNKTLTCAFVVKSSVTGTVRVQFYDGTNFTYGSYNVGTGEQTISLTVTVPVGATVVRWAIICDVASCTVEINDATLCLGTAPLPYVPLHPAEEWARCQRYYQTQAGEAIGESLLVAFCYATTNALGTTHFTPKSVIPSVTVTNPTKFSVNSAVAAAIACTALSGAAISKSRAQMSITVASGLVAGNASHLFTNTDTTGLIAIEANP
jgi:hypothetical protein